MSNINNFSIIQPTDLNEKEYIKTLMQQATKLGMLNDNDISNIQIQTMQLLSEVVYKYNGIESSSIRKEILDNIMESCLYTLSIYLKVFTPDNAVVILKQNSIIELYYKGRKRIDDIVNVCRVIYLKVIDNMLNTKNETYNDTILLGIKGFFKIYDPDFNAHDMKITADYPLYNNLIGILDGVEFIQKYLKSIYYENEFCNMFSSKKVEDLLYSYSKQYKYLIINIFEIVLLECLGTKLLNKNIQDLIITNTELCNIYAIFKNKTEKQIDKIIDNAYKQLIIELLDGNHELKEYIEKNLNSIKVRIKSGVKNNYLDKIFIVTKL